MKDRRPAAAIDPEAPSIAALRLIHYGRYLQMIQLLPRFGYRVYSLQKTTCQYRQTSSSTQEPVLATTSSLEDIINRLLPTNYLRPSKSSWRMAHFALFEELCLALFASILFHRSEASSLLHAQ